MNAPRRYTLPSLDVETFHARVYRAVRLLDKYARGDANAFPTFRALGEKARVSLHLRGIVIDESREVVGATAEQNASALTQWLDDRVRNVLRCVETMPQAFHGAVIEPGAWEGPAKPVEHVRPRTAEECVETFRDAFTRLGVPERDVRVTWDTEANWARLRMVLPTGAIVEKELRSQGSGLANLAALAGWVDSRARGWQRGVGRADLGEVFGAYVVGQRAP